MTLTEGGGSPAASHQPALTNPLTNPLTNDLTNKEMSEMNGDIISDNAQLTAIAALVGRANGYDEVQAEFTPFRDFKLKWTRSYKWISFEVSDYLQDAPREVIASLFRTVFKRLADENTSYEETLSDYITTEDFIRRSQPVYIRRYRGLSVNTDDVAWVEESIDRLREKGFTVPKDLAVGVTETRMRQVGRSSVIMKVVVMNDACRDLPEDARDYAVWSQVAHVSMGFDRNFGAGAGSRAEEYDALLSQYPDRASQESELRNAALYI